MKIFSFFLPSLVTSPSDYHFLLYNIHIFRTHSHLFPQLSIFQPEMYTLTVEASLNHLKERAIFLWGRIKRVLDFCQTLFLLLLS